MNLSLFSTGHYRYAGGQWVNVTLNLSRISNEILNKKVVLRPVIIPTKKTSFKQETSTWDYLGDKIDQIKKAFVNKFSISTSCVIVNHCYTRSYDLQTPVSKMLDDSHEFVNILWLKQVKREKGYITDAQLKYLSKLWDFKDIHQFYQTLFGEIPTDNLILGLS